MAPNTLAIVAMVLVAMAIMCPASASPWSQHAIPESQGMVCRNVPDSDCWIFESLLTELASGTVLALTDLYNATNGPQWKNNTNWLLGDPCTWYGVSCQSEVTELYVFRRLLPHFSDGCSDNEPIGACAAIILRDPFHQALAL